MLAPLALIPLPCTNSSTVRKKRANPRKIYNYPRWSPHILGTTTSNVIFSSVYSHPSLVTVHQFSFLFLQFSSVVVIFCSRPIMVTRRHNIPPSQKSGDAPRAKTWVLPTPQGGVGGPCCSRQLSPYRGCDMSNEWRKTSACSHT